MKTYRFVAWVAVAIGIARLPGLHALYPEPGNVYYGVIRGQGGRALVPGDGVRLVMTVTRGTGTNATTSVVAESDILPATAGGPNFVLRPSLDGGGGNRYSDAAVRVGERVQVFVQRGAVLTEVEGPVPGVAERASVQQVYVTAPCEDTDHDGLCDDWERQYFGSLDITDGTTDLDGDMLTEKMEHDLGSIPTNPDSPLLALLRPRMADDGKFTVEWNVANPQGLAAPTYRLEYTTDAGKPFQPLPPGNVLIDASAPGRISLSTAGTNVMLLRARIQ